MSFIDSVFRMPCGGKEKRRVCSQCGYSLGVSIPGCGNLQHALVISPTLAIAGY